MTKGHKVPNTREAAERRILARQLGTLDTRCNHLTEAARVLIGPADDLGKVATLAAHIVTGETDIHRVAQVAVRLAQRLAIAQAERASYGDSEVAQAIGVEVGAENARLQAELAEARALNTTCTCGKTYQTYEGPESDCAVHGAVRAFNEAAREIERLKAELVQAHAQFDELRRQIDEELAGS